MLFFCFNWNFYWEYCGCWCSCKKQHRGLLCSLCPVSPSGKQPFCLHSSVSSRTSFLTAVSVSPDGFSPPWTTPPLASNLMLTRNGRNKVARVLSTVRINSAKCDLKDHQESMGGGLVPGLATPVWLLKALFSCPLHLPLIPPLAHMLNILDLRMPNKWPLHKWYIIFSSIEY